MLTWQGRFVIAEGVEPFTTVQLRLRGEPACNFPKKGRRNYEHNEPAISVQELLVLRTKTCC